MLRNIFLIAILCTLAWSVAAVTWLPIETSDLDTLQAMVSTIPALGSSYSWNIDSGHPCTWAFITCVNDTRAGKSFVSKISVNSPSPTLSGTFPPSLATLSRLEYFNWQGTSISGEFPQMPASIKSIESFNNPSWGGTPLSTISGNCTNLSYLRLANCNFTGSIPATFPTLCTNLTSFNIGVNQFNGSIPSGMKDLPLDTFRIRGNAKMFGPIPPFHPAITYLSVGDSQVDGNLFNAIASCSNLTDISASGTLLSGTIPVLIDILFPSLNRLEIHGSKFSGSIPPSIANLIQLTELSIGANNWTGTLPQLPFSLKHLYISKLNSANSTLISPNFHDMLVEMVNLTDLQAYSSSGLSGTIPEKFYRLVKQLEFYDIGWSNFSGTISNSLGNLTNLIEYTISGNKFSGTIPPSVGSLVNLKRLYAESCGFEGAIPDSIGNLTKLTKMQLDDNYFTGSIPSSFVNLKSLERLDLDKNMLTGSVPAGLENIRSLARIDLSSNLLSGCPRTFWWAQQECNFADNIFDSTCDVGLICRVGFAIPPAVSDPPATTCVGNECSFSCDTSTTSTTTCTLSGSANISAPVTLVIPDSGVVITGNLTISADVSLQFKLNSTTTNKSISGHQLIQVQQCLELLSRSVDIQLADLSNITAYNESILVSYDSTCSSVVTAGIEVTSNVDECVSGVMPTASESSSLGRGQLSLVFTTLDNEHQARCERLCCGPPALLPLGAIIGGTIGGVVVLAAIIIAISLKCRSVRRKVMPYSERRNNEVAGHDTL